MAKYHITSKGEPGLCRASKSPCPLGGESEHYASKDEAQAAYEKANATNLFLPTPVKPAPNAPVTVESLNSQLDPQNAALLLREKYANFNRARTVNIGEFAEANSGLAPLLQTENFSYVDDDGVEQVVEAIDFGQVQVTAKGEVKLSDDSSFIINRREILAYAEDLNAELSTKGGNSKEEREEKADSIREAAAKVWSAVGLEDLPKAPPTQKSDFYVVVNGERKGVSVKSFMGSPPTIANSSGANSATGRFPTSMSLSEAEAFAETVNSNSSASARLAALREADLTYEGVNHTLPETFSSNIDTIARVEGVDADKLKRDYSEAVANFYLGDKSLTDDQKRSLRTIATHYSRGMNANTPYDPEENDVELFLLQNSDGTSELHTAHNNNMVLLLEEASSSYRKAQLAKVTVVEEKGKVFLEIPLSAGFRTAPNASKRATF